MTGRGLLRTLAPLVLIAVDPALAAEAGGEGGEHHEPFYLSAEFYVAVAFVLFVAGMLYLKVHKTAAAALDARAESIKAELDEAQRLREEAQHTLAEYQRKQRDALKEAEAILAEARAEAERIETSAAERTEELLRRREQQALDMIAAAETQALSDVRALAADVAIDAARRLLNDAVAGDAGDTLVDQAIRDLPSKLN